MDSVVSAFDKHCPTLAVNDRHKYEKVNDIVKDFFLTHSKLMKVKDLYTEELKLGLQANPSRKSVFYMANTFVTDTPDGTECGDFLSMDLGGTNLRILLTKLRVGKAPEYVVKPYHIDIQYRRGNAENLFAFLADCIDDFIRSTPDIDSNSHFPFGFTFSFGFDQISLDKAIITEWSLETDLPDAIGNDAVQYLRSAIDRKGLNVDVMAITNDTTATLTQGLYMDGDASVGMILGSGFNICYLEQVSRIAKIDATKVFPNNPKQVIINTECGFLGDNGSMDFAKTQFDFDIDRDSHFPNNYTLEKLVGGVFLGDLARRVLLSISESKVLLNGNITEKLRTKDSMRAADVSAIDGSDGNNAVIDLLCRLDYQSSDVSHDDVQIIRYVCALLGVRNALILSAILSSLIEHIDKPLIKVAVDGSLYKKHPKLHQLITDFTQFLNSDKKIELFLADDGSGKGSALVAAMAYKNKQIAMKV